MDAQDVEHKETLGKLERGVEGVHASFDRLDKRISGVGQTAARIGDHLQSADAQREAASQSIELIKYLIEFNRQRGDILPPAAIFSDDSRMGEAAAIAQKLRTLTEEESSGGEGDDGQATPGLEMAVSNLQEYCSDLENKLLMKFDYASTKLDLAMMADCAKILDQFQRGNQAINRYVATRPMFMDVEVIDSDMRLARGETTISSLQANANPTRGLSLLYKEIIETMKDEAATVAAVFPSPKSVMALLTQRVMMQRVQNVLEAMLPKPSLDNPPPLDQGGLVLYLRTLAAAYEKTMDLAKELKNVGCGDLDVEGLAQRDLFLGHIEIYHDVEQKSLMQLFHAKYMEVSHNNNNTSSSIADPVPVPVPVPVPGSGIGIGIGSSSPQINRPSGLVRSSMIVTDRNPATSPAIVFVTDCVRWNEEAIARCQLLTPEPVQLAENAQMVFGVLVDQVSVYTMLSLERSHKALLEAAALRDKFSITTSVSRRVAAAAAAAAEQAAVAGEAGVRSFLQAVKRASANVATVHMHLSGRVAPLLLALESEGVSGIGRWGCAEELQRRMADAELAALMGLQACTEAAMAEVERLLAAEQKAADFRPPEDRPPTDHRPTRACMQVISYLERLVEVVQSSLEGPNRLAFMSNLGKRLHKSLLAHIQRFAFNLSGGLRLKRDFAEYSDFVRTFKAPSIDEDFEAMGALVNLFIVAPESLPTIVESCNMRKDDAMAYILLREDYKSAGIQSIFDFRPMGA